MLNCQYKPYKVEVHLLWQKTCHFLANSFKFASFSPSVCPKIPPPKKFATFSPKNLPPFRLLCIQKQSWWAGRLHFCLIFFGRAFEWTKYKTFDIIYLVIHLSVSGARAGDRQTYRHTDRIAYYCSGLASGLGLKKIKTIFGATCGGPKGLRHECGRHKWLRACSPSLSI